MRIFGLYTLARLGAFALCYGVIWLVIFHWVHWDVISGFATAALAMLASSVISLFWLRGLRDRFTGHLYDRSQRARAVYDARRAEEDADDRS